MAFGQGQVNRQGHAAQALARTGGAKAVLGGVFGSVSRALAVIFVVVAVACTPIYSNHGYVPDDKDLADIQTGVDTRDTVAGFLGRPSAEGLLGDKQWFYVQSRWKTYGARAPQEIDRQVVSITFDDAGRVSNIERFGLDKGQVVAISRRITTEPIKGRSALAQIFSSVGRIDPSKFLNQ